MENKTGKYFKYAIGEIVLVVIGILIALQINNWNQNNKRLKQESILLEQLKGELAEVYEDIYSDLYQLRLSERSHFKVLEHIESNLPYNNTLCFDFDLLKRDEYIYPESAIHDKIKDEGLDIIRNDSIRSRIQLLYESVYPRISKGNSFTKDISEYLDDYYINHFKPNTNFNLVYTAEKIEDSLSGKKFERDGYSFPYEYTINGSNRKYTMGFVPLDYEALKKDSKFHMLMNEVDYNRSYKIGRYEYAKKLIKDLVALIDKELYD